MRRVLENGLILRTLSEGFASDRANLPDFYKQVNGEGDPPLVQDGLHVWTRDLIERHPAMTLDDFFVVVDPVHNDRIASATLLIPQTWQYEGIPFPVGRPELVGTLPEYRRRGLVRELMHEVHARSEAMGHIVQGITGIPHYYRQFGYSMALELEQAAFYPLGMTPALGEGEQPAHTLRPMTEADLPTVLRWYSAYCAAMGVADVFDEWFFRYYLTGISPDSVRAAQLMVIVDAAGKPVGYLDLYTMPMRQGVAECGAWIMGEESSYVAVFDDVMRGIRDWANATQPTPPTILQFLQGVPPAVQKMILRTVGGSVRPPSYLWYIRVPDPVRFLKHIGPALERRLEGSGANRYTGTLKIGFYDMTGIELRFAQGKLADVTKLKQKDGYDISFPWHMLWNLVFGRHSWEELRVILPEVYCGPRAAVLVDTLFPKRPTFVRGTA